jgi:hypothetical protein
MQLSHHLISYHENNSMALQKTYSNEKMPSLSSTVRFGVTVHGVVHYICIVYYIQHIHSIAIKVFTQKLLTTLNHNRIDTHRVRYYLGQVLSTASMFCCSTHRDTSSNQISLYTC